MIAYIITKRICLGLQRKDNHLIEHGVETGIIRQLPGGEFIEETRPVDEDALAVLTSRSELPAAAGRSRRPRPRCRAPGMRGGRRPGPRAAVQGGHRERAAAGPNGHGNGHGNGHAIEGNGHGHTAISSGASSTQADSPEGDDH